jgi:hypothetical protein
MFELIESETGNILHPMKQTLTIPTGWDDVTIRQFQDYTRAMDLANTTREKIVATLTTMCNIDEAHVMHLPSPTTEKIMKTLTFLGELPRGDEPLVQTFNFGDVDFGFIPNWTRLTLGEYVDLETYTTNGNMVENLHKVLAIMYRPITNRALHQYEIASYEPSDEMANIMMDVTMDIAISAAVFFYTIAERFAIDMGHYLNQRMEDPPTTHSGLNGVGIE